MVAVFKLPQSLKQEDAQGELQLEALDGSKINPWGMGVLADGTPFLTQRGLATLCGVENAHIGTISSQWKDPLPKPRINKIRDILLREGLAFTEAHEPVRVGGRLIYAYPEEICLAVIEYYAFEAGQFCQSEAKDNFRVLARKGFREAIYELLDYNPKKRFDNQWRPFHDRLSLVYNNAPDGYFSIFKESAELTLTLGQNGIFANDKLIPDISVGKCWSHHWSKQGLSKTLGEPLRYRHNYPGYFPQAVSNPQTPWAYPEAALGEFKRWLREDYIRGGKFAGYVNSQINKKAISKDAANKALAAYDLPQLANRRSA